ncbi:MAG: hypothetical protein WCE94_15230 [Candidatus Methanoperedens sp.]
MVESTITPQKVTKAGVAITLAAANADGSKFLNTGREVIHVKNTDASPVNVTLTQQHDCEWGVLHVDVIAVPETIGDLHIGPFPVAEFNDANGYMHVTFDSVTALTIAVVQVPLA